MHFIPNPNIHIKTNNVCVDEHNQTHLKNHPHPKPPIIKFAWLNLPHFLPAHNILNDVIHQFVVYPVALGLVYVHIHSEKPILMFDDFGIWFLYVGFDNIEITLLLQFPLIVFSNVRMRWLETPQQRKNTQSSHIPHNTIWDMIYIWRIFRGKNIHSVLTTLWKMCSSSIPRNNPYVGHNIQ